MWAVEARDGALVGHVSGRIDELHWEAFAEGMKAAVAQAAAEGLGKLILDLSSVEYISSRGLRGLTLGKRKADEAELPIILAAPNDLVSEILAISRYDKIFRITDTLDTALEG